MRLRLDFRHGFRVLLGTVCVDPSRGNLASVRSWQGSFYRSVFKLDEQLHCRPSHAYYDAAS